MGSNPIGSTNLKNTKKMKKIALIDMDGTLVDYDGAFLRDLKRISNKEERELIESYKGNVWKMCTENFLFERRRHMITSQYGWWTDLNPIEENIDVVRLMHEMDFEIHICTKGPFSKPFSWMEKVESIKKNIDVPVKMNIVTDKSLFYGAVLFDDYIPFVEKWLKHRPRGLGILPNNEGNKGYSHSNAIHYDGSTLSFESVKEALNRVLERHKNYENFSNT